MFMQIYVKRTAKNYSNADLCEKDSEKLFQRSENGIEKALEILMLLLNNDFEKIRSFENVEILDLSKKIF